MTRTRLLLLVLLGSLPVTARAAVPGSGQSKQEERQVPTFSKIALHDALRANISVGDKVRVEVSGDHNLVPLVSTTVEGSSLIVMLKDHVSVEPKQPLLVRISMPKLSAVLASGSAQAEVRGPALGDLHLDASGASFIDVRQLASVHSSVKVTGGSTVTAVGTSKLLKAECTGASKFLARGLRSETATVAGSGGSQIEVCAQKTLDIDLSGASHADVYCTPTDLRPQQSGASTLSQR